MANCVAMEKMTENPSDETLMLQFAQGNAEAFEILLLKYQDEVFRFVYRFLKNKESAEEATQEAFINIIKAAPRYEPKAKFKTWMYRIVRNYCIDCLRRAKVRKTTSLDKPYGDQEGGATLLDRIVDPESDLETNIADQEIHAHLMGALDCLNPDQKEVFLMRENLGLAFHEIAEVLDVSTNTVKSRMRYALLSLKTILEKRLQPVRQLA